MTLITARRPNGLKFALPLDNLKVEVVFKPHDMHKFHVMARGLSSVMYGESCLLKQCDTADEVTRIIDDIEQAKKQHVDVDISF